MPLVDCPDCGREISDVAPACPNCGRPASQRGEAQVSEAVEHAGDLEAVQDPRRRGLSRGAHFMHGLLTVMTLGLWGGIWALVWAGMRFGAAGVKAVVVVLLVGIVSVGYISHRHYEALPPEAKKRMELERLHYERAATAKKAKAAANKAEKERTRRCKDDARIAFIMSHDFVKRQLKAPSSAKFPRIGSDGVRVGSIGSCSYSVNAYVDAQNGFGAMIRRRYYAKLKPTDGGSWQIEALKFLD